MGGRDLDPARAWNTWDARYPAQLVHASTGFCVRVSAFSTRDGRFTDFRYDPGRVDWARTRWTGRSSRRS